MKKLITIILLMGLMLSAFGSPASEVQTITLLHGGDTEFKNGDSLIRHAISKLKVDYPLVNVELLELDLSGGSTMTIDALIAAGTPPNVYMDYIGRTSKYLIPEYALNLSGNVRDLNKYGNGILSPYTRDGKILGLPQPGGAQGMCINLEIMDDIGFTVPTNWTIADFLEMAELVKIKYNGEKYATGMFAANQSGDYLINNWFAAFGVEFYKSGDYSQTTIKATGGAKVYEFFQSLVSNGYIPSGAATLTDDDYVIQWAAGDLAATAFFPGWTKPYIDTVLNQGLRTEPFDFIFVPFPRAEGVSGVPTYVSNAAIVVNKTGTQNDIYSARLAEYLNDAYVQSNLSVNNVIPNRIDAVMMTDDQRVKETQEILANNGIFDVGLTTPFFSATRPQHYPVLQKVLNLQVTPEQGITEFETRLNSILQD